LVLRSKDEDEKLLTIVVEKIISKWEIVGNGDSLEVLA